ncbi:uncharacterized protein METZ01_LOCUS191234, partial [marine metagenome]
RSIQSGINFSSGGDSVTVAAGTYVENVSLNKTIVLMSSEGAESTIIDANNFGTVLTVNPHSTQSYYGYPDIHADATVDGFTIQNGYTSGSSTASGGIIIGVSNTVIKNCIIKNNNSHQGGGVYAEGGTFYNCEILNNTAEFEGGGIFMTYRGFSGFEQTIIQNCLIANNNCGSGAGLFGPFNIVNSNIVNNTGNYGFASAGTSSIKNSIFYGNDGDEIGSFTATVTYSLIEDGYPGTGNIDADPLFADTANGDYRLSDYSPAIGAGTATGAPTTDIDGTPRPNPAGSSPDMGAYESMWASRLPIAGDVRDGLSGELSWSNSTTTIGANWDMFTDNGPVSYEVGVGTQSDSMDNVGNWAIVGTDTFAVITGLNLQDGVTYFVSVRGTDSDNQPSDTTTSDGFTVDTVLPQVLTIMEGSNATDQDYHSSTTSLPIGWTGSDDASGINFYEVTLGTAAGDSNTVDWISQEDSTSATLANLSLVEGSTYYASVRLTDIAGNISAVLSGDGVLIDFTDPVTGTIIDGTTEDLIFTGSSNTLTATWTGFSDPASGISHYEYAIGTSSESSDIAGWTSVALDTTVTRSGLSLGNGNTYYISVQAS